jgi:hypothetical protein
MLSTTHISYRGSEMNKIKIKREISKLLEAEATLLVKFALSTDYTMEEMNYICEKIFEMSDLILRLRKTLKDMRNDK